MEKNIGIVILLILAVDIALNKCYYDYNKKYSKNGADNYKAPETKKHIQESQQFDGAVWFNL